MYILCGTRKVGFGVHPLRDAEGRPLCNPLRDAKGLPLCTYLSGRGRSASVYIFCETRKGGLCVHTLRDAGGRVLFKSFAA